MVKKTIDISTLKNKYIWLNCNKLEIRFTSKKFVHLYLTWIYQWIMPSGLKKSTCYSPSFPLFFFQIFEMENELSKNIISTIIIKNKTSTEYMALSLKELDLPVLIILVFNKFTTYATVKRLYVCQEENWWENFLKVSTNYKKKNTH